MATPPYKKRRLMPQSVTDYSSTPSPPITPRYSENKNTNSFQSPLMNNRIPHVNSTPIRNYFARFTNYNDTNTNSNTNSNTDSDRNTNKSMTPRTLWSNSDKIIPFPPSPLTPLWQQQRRNNIITSNNKYNELYHPLCDIIKNRIDLNVFNESYLNKTKKYYDQQPFLDPLLQTKMRDNVFKLTCDMNDYKSAEKQSEIKEDKDDKDAMDILQTYGDTAITNILNNAENDSNFELANTEMERAKQFIQYLRGNNGNDGNSYNDMKEGVIFLSGILEYITANIVDSAGYLAKYNHSITEMDGNHAEIFRNYMNENKNMITQYDKDVFKYDIDKNCFIIRPLHIRHAIADDDQLFWLQQSISVNTDNNNNIDLDNNNECENGYLISDIEDTLNKDCVYHICSFFEGDLPMLSSLARVNTTFYAMTSSNNLWKPIAIRCFLFNEWIIKQIEDNDNDDEEEDFRSYISLSQHVKLRVMRERWIKQNNNTNTNNNNNNETFEIFVRINPVYIDLHEKIYNLLYANNIDLDEEIFDLFHQLVEIFGTRNEFVSISQIINNVKCLDYNEIKKRLSDVFAMNSNTSLSDDEENNLNKVIEIEYNENSNDKHVLFIELPLNHHCFQNNNDNNNNNMDMDNDKHYLWIGKHIVIFAAVPSTISTCNQKLEL